LGRGYLQQGSELQGRRLSSNPQTATERALQLQDENTRLRAAIMRFELELKNRTSELAAARNSYRDQEEELVRAMNQVNELKRRQLQAEADLKVAIQEKENIKRRSDEQLKAIESTLDGVLLNSISQNQEQ
jgi:chromosome segregation ATPase